MPATFGLRWVRLSFAERASLPVGAAIKYGKGRSVLIGSIVTVLNGAYVVQSIRARGGSWSEDDRLQGERRPVRYHTVYVDQVTHRAEHV